jgi:hypothetical protein
MFREYLHRTYQALTRGRKRRAPKTKPAGRPAATRLTVLSLEDRTLLSTLQLSGGVLTYTPSANVANSLTMYDNASTHRYTFLDAYENITLTGNFINPLGSGNHTVSFGDGNIHAITIYVPNAHFTVNTEQTLAVAPVTVLVNNASDVVNISPIAHNLSNIQGAINVYGGFNSISDSLNVYDQSSTAAQTFSMGTNSSSTGYVSRSGAAAINYNDGITSLAVNGGSGNNTYNVRGTAAHVTILNTGNGHDTVNVDGGSITVNDGTGGVDVNVAGSSHDLNAISYVEVHGAVAGLDNLILNDQANTSNQIYTLDTNSVEATGSYAAIYYSNLSHLTVNGGTGVDEFAVLATSAPTDIVGHANATVYVGNASGTVGDITHNLTITDPPAYSYVGLYVDDFYDTGFRTATFQTVTIGSVSYGQITGLAPATITYKYQDTSFVTVQTGSGGANLNVLATGSQLNLDTVGNATDTVTVGNAGRLDQIKSPLTMGGESHITVNVDDSMDPSPRTVTLDTESFKGRITGLAPATVDFSYLDTDTVTVQTGTGGATVNVLATGVPTSIVGHHDGTVNIGNAGSVQQIVGPLTITNPPDYTTVNVDDSADGTTRNVTLDTATIGGFDCGRITGLAPSAIQYRYIDTTSATIETGPGGATVHALAVGKPVNLVGNPNAGMVSLVGSDADNTWNVMGQNAGTLNSSQGGGPVTFSNVQNLTGGAGADTFVFADGAGVDGTIDGGSGSNTLDYSAYSSSVLVDLQTGFATGVGGGIANIQNVTGGTGGGAGVYNILVGNGGNVLRGGDGRRNLLIAGASASTLLGGSDDDILIGGTTAYDTEAGLVSLQAIMDYWSGTADDYGTRVANLLSGTGVPLLDATMVTNNGGGNTLMGNHGGAGEMNLFYGMAPTLETTDYNPAIGEQFVNC